MQERCLRSGSRACDLLPSSVDLPGLESSAIWNVMLDTTGAASTLAGMPSKNNT